MSWDWDVFAAAAAAKETVFRPSHATLCYNDSDTWWPTRDTAGGTFLTFDLCHTSAEQFLKNRWLLLPETGFNKGNGV